MTFYIVPIVEGQTEVNCIERLLHRTWAELLAAPNRLQVLPASRGKRDALLNPDHPDLADKVEEAYVKLSRRLAHDLSGTGMLLLLLDAESDCPAIMAPTLLAAARKARSNTDICCVVAKRMLENWIVAGASTLAGVNGLPDPLPTRDRFEERRGAAWLGQQLCSKNKTRKYKKTADAEPFVRAMSLVECRENSPSFDKFCRELEKRLPSVDVSAPPGDDSPPAGSDSPSIGTDSPTT